MQKRYYQGGIATGKYNGFMMVSLNPTPLHQLKLQQEFNSWKSLPLNVKDKRHHKWTLNLKFTAIISIVASRITFFFLYARHPYINKVVLPLAIVNPATK